MSAEDDVILSGDIFTFDYPKGMPKHVTVKTTVVPSEELPAAKFVERWGIDAVTKLVQPIESGSSIKIRYRQDTLSSTVWNAYWHEIGHVQQADDVFADGVTLKELINGDRWAVEVAAWVGGIELADGARRRLGIVNFDHRLILDALNTYRRSLRVSDERWQEARRLIFNMLNRPDDGYVPLEPEPDDEPPKCGGFGPPNADDESDANGSEDDGEGSGTDDDPADGSEDEDGTSDDGTEDDGTDNGGYGRRSYRTKRDTGAVDPKLLTQKAVDAASQGREAFMDWAQANDADISKLPAVISALLGG